MHLLLFLLPLSSSSNTRPGREEQRQEEIEVVLIEKASQRSAVCYFLATNFSNLLLEPGKPKGRLVLVQPV